MKLKHYLRTITALAGLLILSFSALAASTNEVAIDGTKPFTSIQKAILASKNGDIVLVYPGVYKENIDFKGKNITVSSIFPISRDWSSITNTIIDGDANGLSVVTFESGESPAAKLVGFTVSNGNTPVTYHGGGITVRLASATISYCRIIGNHAAAGGGIQFNYAGTGSIVEQCTLEENSASQGGAIYVIASNVSINGSFFTGNTGGCFYWYGQGGVDISNSMFIRNSGQSVIAGPAASPGGQIVLVNCSILENKTTLVSVYSAGVCFIVNSILQDSIATQLQVDGVAFLDNDIFKGGTNAIKATSTTSIKYGTGNISSAISIDSSCGRDGVPAQQSAAIGGGVSLVQYPGRTIVAGGRDVYDTKIFTNASVPINIGAVQLLSAVAYATNSFSIDEDIDWGADANQEAIAFYGGVHFQLESGPDGLVIDSSTGHLSWTPTEAQGPGTYPAKIRATAVSTPNATDIRTVTLKVGEVNLPPLLGAVATQSVVERNLWTIKLGASDPDLPANPLSYRMVNGPSSVSVDSKKGGVSWIPGEADGGQGYDMVFEVSDNGVPPLVSQTTVHLDVSKVNDPPTLRAIGDLNIPEMQSWSLKAVGEDIDLPPQTISYSLPLAPDGMVIDSGSGVMSWPPTEAQGPGSYPVTVRVTDPLGLWVEQRFTVTVTEVNTPPVLSGMSDQYFVYGQALNLQLAASDRDLPQNLLSYKLVSSPTNAVLSPTGLLSWSPTRSQSPSSNIFAVSLSDGLATVTNRFSVEVLDLITTLDGKETTNSLGALPGAMVGFINSKPSWLVFYTLDGSQPDANSTYFLAAFELLQSSTVWPIAYSPDFSQSVLGIPVKINLLKPQVITVLGGTGLTFQGPSVAVVATSSSGLPVNLSVVSGPAHLENGKLVADGGGSVKIRATQVGDDTWAPTSVDTTLVIDPAAQTINWGNLPTLVYGMPPISIEAKASSGLPVSYALISGPASLSGNVLTLTGAGTVVLQAKQAGNANFASGQWNTSYEIAKAPQTISFSNPGEQSFSLTPITLGGSASSKMPISYDILSGPATVLGDKLILNGIGLVKVRANQSGNANYEAAISKEQSFTVSKGAQIISFAEISQQTFGTTPVQLIATASSGLPVVFQVVSGPGSVTGDSLTIEGAGTIVVLAHQAGDAFNFAATVSQEVTVAKASQSISFEDLTDSGYSTNAVSLTAIASSGLPVSFRMVSGSGKIFGSTLTLTGIGSIVIAADQNGGDNYLAANSVTNQFIVSRGPQTISFQAIPDQLVSSQTVKLSATSSAGLPVAYIILSGPATISGNILKMLNGGQVIVRALNPGNPLYLSAQADQSFIAAPMINSPIAVTADGSFILQVRAPVGSEAVVEEASDLANWIIVQQLSGKGLGNPVGLTIKPNDGDRTRFWRVRLQ